MASINVGKLYKRGVIWYFRVTGSDGKRIQRSTGQTIKKNAYEYAYAYLAKLGERGDVIDASSLRAELERYIVPESNPRYRQAMIQGKSYTIGYAKQVARHCTLLISLLQDRFPEALSLHVDEITRRDVKAIQVSIVEERGNTRTAQHIFGTLKTVFSYLVDDGILQQSVAAGIPDIGYEAKKIIAIEPELIAWMISQKNLFPSHRAWAFFTILATTGMRKSEAMAIDSGHIHNGTLMIDQQVSPHQKDMAKPKCGVIRAVPLSRLAQEAITSIQPDEKGRYFPTYKYSSIATDIGKIRAALSAVDQDNADIWRTLTPHMLRHSANTNLLVSGCNPVLVAEYLAWRHQELIDMQRRYTHMVAMNLKPVADMLDELYSPRKETKNLYMKQKQS